MGWRGEAPADPRDPGDLAGDPGAQAPAGGPASGTAARPVRTSARWRATCARCAASSAWTADASRRSAPPTTATCSTRLRRRRTSTSSGPCCRRPKAPDPRAALDCLESAVGLVTGELLAGEPYARWANQERAVRRTSWWARPPRRAARGEPRRAGGGGADGADGGGRRRAGGGGLAVVDARLLALRPALGGPAGLLRAADTLGDELGADPAVETQALYLEILRDEPVVQRPAVGRARRGHDADDLLRRAVESVPGLEVPRTDRALAEVAASLGRVACERSRAVVR